MAKHECIASTSYLDTLYTWATVTSTVPSLNCEGLLPTCCCYGCYIENFAKPLPPYCGPGNQVRERTNQISKQNVVQNSGHIQFRAGQSSDYMNDEDKFRMNMEYFCNKKCTSPSFQPGKNSIQTAMTLQSNVSDYPQERKCSLDKSRLPWNRLSYVAQQNLLTMRSQILLQVGGESNADFDEKKHDVTLTKSFNDTAENHTICCCDICLSSLRVQSLEPKERDLVDGQANLKAAADVDTSKFEDYSLSAVVERACYLPKRIVQQPEAQEHAEHWSIRCIQPDDVYVELQHEDYLRNLNFVEARILYDGDLQCTTPNLCCNDSSVESFAMKQTNGPFTPNKFPVEGVYAFPVYPQFGCAEHNLVVPSLASDFDGAKSFFQFLSCPSIMESNQIVYRHSYSSLDFQPIAQSAPQLSTGEIDLRPPNGCIVKSQDLSLDTRVFNSTSEKIFFREQVPGSGKCYKNSRGKRPYEIMSILTAENKLSRNEEAIYCAKQSLEKENQVKTWKEICTEESSQSPLQECLNIMGKQRVDSDFSIALACDKKPGINLCGIEMTFTDGATDGLPCSDSNGTGDWDSNAASVCQRKPSKDNPSKSSTVLRTHDCLDESGIQLIPKNKHRTRAKKAFMKHTSNAGDHLTEDLSDDFSQVAVALNFDSETEGVDQGFNMRSLQSIFASNNRLKQITTEENLVTSDKQQHRYLDKMGRDIHMATRCDTLQENKETDQINFSADKTISSAKMQFFGGCSANALRNHSIFDSHVVFQYPYSIDDMFGEPLKVLEGKTTSPRLYI